MHKLDQNNYIKGVACRIENDRYFVGGNLSIYMFRFLILHFLYSSGWCGPPTGVQMF